MSRWDDWIASNGGFGNAISNTLGNAAGYVGAGAALGSRIFDFINSGSTPGTTTSATVRDVNTNGFLASKSIYRPKYFVRAFDEPTYLTFKLEFMFHNKRNALFNNNVMEEEYRRLGSINETEEGYDYLPEAFLQDSMLAQNDGVTPKQLIDIVNTDTNYTPVEPFNYLNGDLTLGSSNYIGYYYSAEDYLGLNRGEFGRARLMRKIKFILRDLEENFPYYFKSIEGLNDLNKIKYNAGRRVGDDVVLTIKCYEGLDLKITQLIQMIRKVTWDDNYQRWVLPDIMRYFGMKIYVSEIRTFHEMHRLDLTHPLHNGPMLNLYDFMNDTDGDLANMTEAKQPNNILQTILGITGGILTAAEALGNTFFGDTEFQNAVNSINNSYTALSDMNVSLAQMYQTMCFSAINSVMPTICYECHLCDFDISDTMSEMGTLSSTSKDPQEQVLRIRVRQVEDYQVYPLDRNLTVNSDMTGYAMPTSIYNVFTDTDFGSGAFGTGMNVISSNMDNLYTNLRKNGYTGSTAFADKVFDKRFNDSLRNMYEKARAIGNGVNQVKLYRNLSSLYDDALRSFFTDRMNMQVGRTNVDANSNTRLKMYPGTTAKNLIMGGADQRGALRYKRNSLDVTTNVLTLLIGGLNAASQIDGLAGSDNNYLNSLTGFSKATSLTREDLETALPDVYLAAQELRSTMEQLQQTDFGDTNLGAFELLNNLAFSKATKYTPIGAVASTVLNNLDNPWANVNAYKRKKRIVPTIGGRGGTPHNTQVFHPTEYDTVQADRLDIWSTINQNQEYIDYMNTVYKNKQAMRGSNVVNYLPSGSETTTDHPNNTGMWSTINQNQDYRDYMDKQYKNRYAEDPHGRRPDHWSLTTQDEKHQAAAAAAYENHYVNDPSGNRPENWSTVIQDPEHNRPGKNPNVTPAPSVHQPTQGWNILNS